MSLSVHFKASSLQGYLPIAAIILFLFGCMLGVYCFTMGSAYAQPSDAKTSLSYDGGDIAEADQDFQDALRVWGNGKSAEAQIFLNRALTIRESVLGPSHPEVARVLERLGALDFNREQYPAAEAKFRRTLNIDLEAFGERNIATTIALGDLGAALREERRYREAEPLVLRSLAIRRDLLPANDPAIAGSLDNLGRIYLGERRYAEARSAIVEKQQIDRASLRPDNQSFTRDEALLQSINHAEAGADRLHKMILQAAGIAGLSAAILVGCNLWRERRLAVDPETPQPIPFQFIYIMGTIGLFGSAAFIGTIGLDWTISAVAPAFFADSNTARNIGKIGGALSIWIIAILLQIINNALRSATGIPRKQVLFFGVSWFASMFHDLVKTLYPSNPAVFRSAYPLDEAIRRLREASEPNIFCSLFKQAAVGPVEKDCVRLQRVIPLFGNSFKPIFVGKFKEAPDGVVLEGDFTTFTSAKIFMTIWFGCASIWVAIATIAGISGSIRNPGEVASDPAKLIVAIFFPLFGVFFIAMGNYFLRFCWWLSRGDIDFLSAVIARALTK
jgi:tetratricopeptide (TPR) repeat protein